MDKAYLGQQGIITGNMILVLECTLCTSAKLCVILEAEVLCRAKLSPMLFLQMTCMDVHNKLIET